MTHLKYLTEKQVKEYDGVILSLEELLFEHPELFNITLKQFEKDHKLEDNAKSIIEFRKMFGKSLFTINGEVYEHHK